MNSKCKMPNEDENPKAKTNDLEERTAKFGEQVVLFIKTLPRNDITRPLIDQLIRSVTSVGANYMEADGAESKKDFRHKISICKKEAKESRYWLRIIAVACPEKKEKCRILWKEANELALIFSSIFNSAGGKSK